MYATKINTTAKKKKSKERRKNPLHFYLVAIACDRDGSFPQGLSHQCQGNYVPGTIPPQGVASLVNRELCHTKKSIIHCRLLEPCDLIINEDMEWFLPDGRSKYSITWFQHLVSAPCTLDFPYTHTPTADTIIIQ